MAAAQGKGMDWRPVNPAAHCGRRPFFALGKARAARRPAAVNGQLCPGQGMEWQQRKAREWIGGRSILLPIAAAGRSLPWARQGQRGRRYAGIDGGGQLCPGQGMEWQQRKAKEWIGGRSILLPIAAAGRSLPWARQGQHIGGVLCPGQWIGKGSAAADMPE